MFRLRARRDEIVAAHTDGRFNGIYVSFTNQQRFVTAREHGIIGDPWTLSPITDRAPPSLPPVIFGCTRLQMVHREKPPQIFAKLERMYVVSPMISHLRIFFAGIEFSFEKLDFINLQHLATH